MKSVQINTPFFHYVHIGTEAERLALVSPHPYVYDEFIATDSNVRYTWTGTIWEQTLITDFGYRRYGGVEGLPNSPIPVDTSIGGGAGLPILGFLTATGDGTGPNNLNGDYSAAPETFFFQSPANAITFIKSVSIQISDATDFLQGYYGGIPLSGGLQNGIPFFINNTVIDIPLLAGFAFKTNNDWYGLTSHITLNTFAGGSQTFVVDFKVVEDYGTPLVLPPGWSLKTILSDDFTGLILHRFSVKFTRVVIA